MRRAAVSFHGNYCPLRLEEINVPIGAGIIYRDKVVSIIDLITMQEIRRYMVYTVALIKAGLKAMRRAWTSKHSIHSIGHMIEIK